MRLSTKAKYIAYITALHLVLVLLVYKLLFENKALFIASEVFLLLSAGMSIILYNNFMQPIQFVKSGIEAIKDKDFSIKFVPTGKGEVDVLIEVYNLMIDQLREERIKLNEQHFFLEKLIEASPISIIILDYDDRIESLNSKAKSQFGQDNGALMGKKPEETDLPLLTELASLLDGESRLIKTNGIATFKAQRSHFMDRGFRRSFLMIEELTNEILESEKNAYGKVIRMMAHEVNNTLGATDSILQTTTHLLPDSDYGDIKDALHVASERNQQLTRFMRNFADVVRLPAPVHERTDMGALTRDVAVFMQNAASIRNVTVVSESQENVFWQVDKGQMEQVLINVIKNAVEACESGQEVRISATNSHLAVRNNGKPIDPDVATQLFNPFFSTKRDGQGIGLTLTREILGNHGFDFALETGPDGWTEFRIEK